MWKRGFVKSVAWNLTPIKVDFVASVISPFAGMNIYILQGFVLDKSNDLRCQKHETRKRVKSLKNSVNPLDQSLTVKRNFT